MASESGALNLSQRASAVMVMIGQSFNPLAAVTLVAVLPTLARHFAAGGDGVLFAQLVMVVPCISIIIGSPMAGKLGELVGPRRLMIASLLIYVFAGCFGIVSPGRAPLIVSRIILGIASSFLQTMFVNQTNLFTETRRDRLLGISSAVAGVGTIAGIAAVAWLSGRFGWRFAFILYLWPLPLLPLIILSKPVVVAAGSTTLKDGYFDPIRNCFPIYLLELLLCLMLFAPNIEGPFILLARGLNQPSSIGAIISGTIGIGIAASTSYGWLSQRFAPAGILRIVFGVFLLAAVLISCTSQKLPAEMGLVVSGVAAGLLVPMLLSMLLTRSPAHQSATALGWFASTMFGSQLADPFLFNLIKKYLPVSVFGTIAIVCTIALALLASQNLWQSTSRRAQNAEVPGRDRSTSHH